MIELSTFRSRREFPPLPPVQCWCGRNARDKKKANFKNFLVVFVAEIGRGWVRVARHARPCFQYRPVRRVICSTLNRGVGGCDFCRALHRASRRLAEIGRPTNSQVNYFSLFLLFSCFTPYIASVIIAESF